MILIFLYIDYYSKGVKMKLSDWCRKQGICYMTGYKWFKSERFQMPFKWIMEPFLFRKRDKSQNV